MYMSITPDQLASAGSYISREWGDYGYRIEAIESRTSTVALFRVCASDGGRFSVLTDKWGNCRYLDTHNHDDQDAGLFEAVREMHAIAVNPSGTATP
jgi:hypothetical protein